MTSTFKQAPLKPVLDFKRRPPAPGDVLVLQSSYSDRPKTTLVTVQSVSHEKVWVGHPSGQVVGYSIFDGKPWGMTGPRFKSVSFVRWPYENELEDIRRDAEVSRALNSLAHAARLLQQRAVHSSPDRIRNAAARLDSMLRGLSFPDGAAQ